MLLIKVDKSSHGRGKGVTPSIASQNANGKLAGAFRVTFGLRRRRSRRLCWGNLSVFVVVWKNFLLILSVKTFKYDDDDDVWNNFIQNLSDECLCCCLAHMKASGLYWLPS